MYLGWKLGSSKVVVLVLVFFMIVVLVCKIF